MGNHEYCGECGASDFHRGEPCNPEKKAQHQAWIASWKKAAGAETGGEKAGKVWLLFFEDNDLPSEIFTDEAAAQKTKRWVRSRSERPRLL